MDLICTSHTGLKRLLVEPNFSKRHFEKYISVVTKPLFRGSEGLSKGLCDSEIQTQLLKLLEKTPIPVSIEYVARHLNVGWGTARAMLLELVVSGKVAGQKTTKSWIFWTPKVESKNIRKSGRPRI